MNPPLTARLGVIDAPICCAVDSSPPAARFHCALNVTDLAKSIEFYRILLGVRPANQQSDYAKFELVRPPLVLSLIPHSPGVGRGLRHLAFPVHHPAEVEAVGIRLQTAGLEVVWHHEILLDDARQTAVEVLDPDGYRWRISCRLEDAIPAAERALPTSTSKSSPRGWEHRILQPLPERIPHETGSLDFVRLEGTFNTESTAAQRVVLLSEVHRVLKPGGAVHAHGLVANHALPECPALHGVAALVRRVPPESEPLAELRTAGLIDVSITKYPSNAAFQWGQVELRELKLSAWKPVRPQGAMKPLLYRGPLARLVTDHGETFVRGVPVVVDAATADRFRHEPWRGQFVDLGEDDKSPATASCAEAVE